jgi:DNA-directed RNA polymerase subunit M
MGPTTRQRCPECDNERAYYEMKQIRAADESETRFFTCTECGHKWREDDH